VACCGLTQRAQQGDVDALEELCAREWKPIYTVLFHIVGDPTEAQDLTQEVFLRALRSLDRYEDRGIPFRAYLMTIARNLARNHWRSLRWQAGGLNDAGNISTSADDPVDHALLWDELERLQQGLDDLSADHRQVLELRIIEGLSAAEVGRRMGRSPDAVRQLQRRAILTLQSLVKAGAKR
jgi:RNA polymerase sigma-70 factor (ECF subfamily)